MSVLVIEDDREISHSVCSGLKRAGFEASSAMDGESGLRMATSDAHEAIVLDLMLPGMDGLTLLETIRARGIKTPVIVLSAKRSTDDKVTCLRRGADDYLAKPFDLPELLARLEAVLRRSQPAGEASQIESAGVCLDLVNRTARREDVRLELSPREFGLLELLMRNEGRPLSKYYLIERLWDYSFAPQTNLVDVLVCRLRNKIDRDFQPPVIHTVRGIGYVFRAN